MRPLYWVLWTGPPDKSGCKNWTTIKNLIISTFFLSPQAATSSAQSLQSDPFISCHNKFGPLSNAITNSFFIGTVGLDWQFSAVGNFSSRVA